MPVGPQENLRLTFFFCKSGSWNFLPHRGAAKLNPQASVKRRDVTVTGGH